MTTRIQLRAMLRHRLEDTGPDPLWTDDILNDAIAEAIRRYSTHLPRQAVAAIPVMTGDQEIDMPEDVNALRIVRLFDDRGQVWPRWEGSGVQPPVPGNRDRNETWRVWANSVLLGTPVTRSGLWRIEHLIHRDEPRDDISPIDMQPNDEDILVALALSVALNRRAISEGKRYTGKSGVHPLAAAARSAEADADRMFWQRTQKLRGSTLQSQAS